MTVGVLVPAAGRGERLGAGVAKAMRPVRGEPLVVHAVRTLLAAPSVDLVVVAAPPRTPTRCARCSSSWSPGRRCGWSPAATPGRSRSRPRSRSCRSDVEVVLVHDAARALVPVDLVDAVVAAVRDGRRGAVVPAVPLRGHRHASAPTGRRRRRPWRRCCAVQTPQGFVAPSWTWRTRRAARRARCRHRRRRAGRAVRRDGGRGRRIGGGLQGDPSARPAAGRGVSRPREGAR